ncbi:MAG: 3'-5' exonuclease [Candidatus Kaelpia aquatica]|nr:3'-5' exonuclease [Candidatus Kaelpia aquatica]
MKCVVFDCETTGLSPYSGDKICEIGAVKLDGDKIIDQYCHLINPERDVSYAAYMVNKITQSMLRDAPTIDEILPSFLKFIEGNKLAAYNAGFDISFLNSALHDCGYKDVDSKEVIDIYILAKKMLPDLEKYPLWNVAKSLELPIAVTHRALDDAQLTADVFLKLTEMGADKFLKIICLDYAQKTKIIEGAIRSKQPLKIRFTSKSGNSLEKNIVPYRIKELNGEEVLCFESEHSSGSIALHLIEEVVL